jgi:hypothetical protein
MAKRNDSGSAETENCLPLAPVELADGRSFAFSFERKEIDGVCIGLMVLVNVSEPQGSTRYSYSFYDTLPIDRARQLAHLILK